MCHLDAPDYGLLFAVATVQHVDDGLATLAQADAVKHRRRSALLPGFFPGGVLLCLLLCNRCLQCGDGSRHVARLDDAFGLHRFTDQLQKLLALRLEQYQVTGRFGFEFIEHVSIVRLVQRVNRQLAPRGFKLTPL